MRKRSANVAAATKRPAGTEIIPRFAEKLYLWTFFCLPKIYFCMKSSHFNVILL
ncbi:hypothetical protein ACIQ57_20010 [Lysinibacillus xylanilyticus]|uniref:hypothetical protein n=1 Tax=Lysinibacillus xylanilyticus TaxID=582475 RepID=UPI003822AB84